MTRNGYQHMVLEYYVGRLCAQPQELGLTKYICTKPNRALRWTPTLKPTYRVI